MRRVLGFAAATACVAMFPLAGPVSAQSLPENGAPDPSVAHVRFGPLWLNPTIDMTNFGIDTNVFNEPASQGPKQDVTLTVVPKTQVWMPIGRSWLSGGVDEQLVWYQKYTGERSVNSLVGLGWKIPVSRITLDVAAKYLDTRQRPSFEIDVRSQRVESSFTGKVELRALSKTYFGASASRQRVDFASDAKFLNASLHDELNRTVTTGTVLVRQQVTPLTSIGVDASREEDRFDFDPLRNSNATGGNVTVVLDPQALVKGSVRIGYQQFQPIDRSIPGYSGATATVDLSYVLLGSTRFAVQATRAIQYSFEVDEPYYLQTGVSGSVAQQIFGPLEVLVRGGLQHLSYRDRIGTSVIVPARLDTVTGYGVGVGYHVGTRLRLGVNLDDSRRSSPLPDREYSGRIAGASATYAF